MATASFNTLSPNTKAYRFTSTCNELNMANIVNGSYLSKKKYNRNMCGISEILKEIVN